MLPLHWLVLLALSGGEDGPSGSVKPTWSRFRGPAGAGLARDAKPLPALLEREKNLLWSHPVPPGQSSPCISGGRVIVTGHENGRLTTVCLDQQGGAVLWSRSVEAQTLERSHRINGPAAATPTTDGERIVAHFGSFGLVAYDMLGEELWRRPLKTPRNTFGSAASPIIVDGDLIFLSDSEEGSFLEALDPASGEILWRTEREGFNSGWSTPATWSRAGARELLVLGVGWLTAYDLDDGSERWAYPGLTDEPITTPITGNGLVYATSYNLGTNTDAMLLWSFERVLVEHDHDGDGVLDAGEIGENQSVLSRPDADGEGDHPLRIFTRFLDADRDGRITAKEYEKLVAWVDSFEQLNGIVALRPDKDGGGAELVWHYPRGVPECPSPLYHDGLIYMVMNGGTLTCLDGASGELVFQERLPARGPYYASLVAGDGKLYAASARGEVTVLAASRRLEVLSTIDLEERLMATPALSDGAVFVRTEERVHAFGDRQEERSR